MVVEYTENIKDISTILEHIQMGRRRLLRVPFHLKHLSLHQYFLFVLQLHLKCGSFIICSRPVRRCIATWGRMQAGAKETDRVTNQRRDTPPMPPITIQHINTPTCNSCAILLGPAVSCKLQYQDDTQTNQHIPHAQSLIRVLMTQGQTYSLEHPGDHSPSQSNILILGG